MYTPLISLIVPVYNVGEYLPRFMKCIDKQLYKNLEILLIDDGSTDDSGKLCDAYAEKDSRVLVFHIPNGGVAGARNHGLRRFSGQYLMFADADDLFSSNYVSRLYELISSGNTHVATCMAHNCRDTGLQEYEYEGRHDPEEQVWGNVDYTSKESRRVVWGAIYDRYAVEGIFFDEQYVVTTDTLFFIQVFQRVGCYLHTAEELYCYVIYKSSLSHRKFDRIRYDDIQIWERIYGTCPEGSLSRSSCTKVLVKKYKKGMAELLRENSDPVLFREMCRAVKKHRKDRLVTGSKKEKLLSEAFLSAPSAYMHAQSLFRKSKKRGAEESRG